jgi:hypothetical protein
VGGGRWCVGGGRWCMGKGILFKGSMLAYGRYACICVVCLHIYVTDMQNNALVMSKVRCNMAKTLPKRRKTLNMSKTCSVAIPDLRGQCCCESSSSNALIMLGSYKHANLNSGFLGYNLRLIFVWWWWWYILNVHTPNSSFTFVDSSSEDAR